jgi:hypothetical protein
MGAGILSASALLIWQGTLHQVTASAPEEEMPVLQVTATREPIRATATKPAPLTSQPTRAPLTSFPSSPTPAIDLPAITFIGDSIMQGAAPMFDDAFGESIYIDAERKRRMEDVPALVETLSEEGHLSKVVVIHLGSNRPFDEDVFDEVMESLLAHDVERVIFINVHRPIGWEFYINRIFAESVARWPQAELIDWDALAHSEQGWFIRDQTHLSFAGSEAYVAAIQAKLEEGQ